MAGYFVELPFLGRRGTLAIFTGRTLCYRVVHFIELIQTVTKY